MDGGYQIAFRGGSENDHWMKGQEQTNMRFFERILHGRLNRLFAVALPFILFLLHASLFRNWIIDDAGISFAYARSLANGYGLVSQPGLPPVEGFSNPLWTLLITPFFLTKTFDPIITPKILSVLIVLFSFIVISKILELISKKHIFGTYLVLTVLAANTSFVVWTTSGLENPLYVLLTLLLLWQILQFQLGMEHDSRAAFLIAMLSALCGLVRPDGVLFSTVFPFVLIAQALQGRIRIKDVLRIFAVYASVFVLIFGSYIAFRYVYFGDLLPNTFYAKAATFSFRIPDGYQKLVDLFYGAGLPQPFAIGLLLLACYGFLTQRLTSQRLTLCLLLLISMAIYILLPQDWMPEFRFATPFYALFYLLLFAISTKAVEQAKSRMLVGVAIVLPAVLFTAANVATFTARTFSFWKNPPVPFSIVGKE